VRECEDAMGAYLMMFASIGAGLPLPVINLIAAVIYYYINRSKSRFVRFHSLQSLISQIPLTLLNSVAVFWTIRILFYNQFNFSDTYIGYVIMLFLANIIYFIFSIVGAVKARKGRFYYFVFFGKVAYESVYKIKEETVIPEVVNKPPNL
ncbi:MAG: DUF4870 domain-containing protein, partial [Bacteroidetes bacterium]|nr:DUF4870 domain-containing protein [Bacteroidota bacterium]HET6244505.1 DUF4870 domain-containing protein [Bacteroidia bacterium]